jgi:hypothetical protein
MVYAPLAVVQNPASWTPFGAGVVTTGVLAPDGSTMAATVSGGGALCYDQNHTVAVGDYILAGVWIRHPSGGVIVGSDAHVELVSAGGFVVNGGGGGNITDWFLSDRISNNGWVWACAALKITAIGTNPVEIRFRLSMNGSTRQYFNPCAMLIPASAGYDEVWLISLARSMKGGWSTTSVRGDTGVLDHQTFKAGVFKATAKTFATLPTSPVAGMQAYITDCNTATWGATAAGGGSTKVLVWYNGSNWTVIGK